MNRDKDEVVVQNKTNHRGKFVYYYCFFISQIKVVFNWFIYVSHSEFNYYLYE